MKLLIVTQVVDKNHPILGFFHRWIEEFSKHCEVVHVICLQAGEYQLPPNVYVHSLGKEERKGRLIYLYRFYKYIWTLRHEYDQVFVHMNQIYVLLGGIFWRTQGKKIGLWYAHGAVTMSLRFAVALSNTIFTSTLEGFNINTAKLVIVGQGIDTKIFTTISKSPRSKLELVTVGRISQSKNIETLLKACSLIKQHGILFRFRIIGVATTNSEELYATKIKQLVNDLNLDSEVEWVGSISNDELPFLLQDSDIFISDSSTNSLDKALLEAVLCGCLVISSNLAFRNITSHIAPEMLFKAHDQVALANILINRGNSDVFEKLRQKVMEEYSIYYLIKRIINRYT